MEVSFLTKWANPITEVMEKKWGQKTYEGKGRSREEYSWEEGGLRF